MASGKSADILRAAMELFSERSYAGTSMRDIADAVGLQPGSLYAHIRSKEDLLVEIIDRASEEFLAAGAAAVEDVSRPAADRLRDLIRAHLQIIAENKASATVFLHEWRSLEGERMSAALQQRNEYEQLLVDVIEQGVRRREFRPLDSRLAGVAVLSLVNWAYTWYSPAGKLSAATIADEFTDMLVSGFRRDPVRRNAAPVDSHDDGRPSEEFASDV